MAKFWEMYQQSIIITGSLAVMVTAGYIYMVCRQIPVPTDYYFLLTGCVGFFFGSKSGYGSGQQAAKHEAMKKVGNHAGN